ncbi:hypothetical protein D9M72_363470 [compost metagenome]
MSLVKFSIRLTQVSTRLGKASGKAFATKMKKVNPTTPAPITIPRYFKGYLPTNTSITTIEKIRAAVEKLAGKISSIIANTGSHNSITDFWNVSSTSRFFARYLAT